MNTDRFETEHLVLRKARDADLDAIWHNVWEDESIAKMMLWQPTKTREAAEDRMRRTKNYQKSFPAYFVCLKETDEPIGFGGFREIGEGEFEESGVCFAVPYQNRGFGKEVLRALVTLAFEGFGGHRFVAGCFHENLRSVAVIKGCGFVYTHSSHETRDWDGYEYLCDFYELRKAAE